MKQKLETALHLRYEMGLDTEKLVMSRSAKEKLEEELGTKGIQFWNGILIEVDFDAVSMYCRFYGPKEEDSQYREFREII